MAVDGWRYHNAKSMLPITMRFSERILYRKAEPDTVLRRVTMRGSVPITIEG